MKTYKISDISIYPFNENGKKFVEEIRCYLNTNEKLTERINNIFDNGCHSHFHDVSNNGMLHKLAFNFWENNKRVKTDRNTILNIKIQ